MKTLYWLFFFTFMMLVLFGAFYKKWKLDEQEIYQQHIQFNRSIIKATTQQYQVVADAIFEEAINTEPVLQIMNQVKGASLALNNRLRGRLYKQLFPVYQRLKKRDFRQFHFHLPDNTSFLRFHRLEHYGDLLSATRYSVKLANETRNTVHGFESGKHFQAYRNVFPLNYQGKNLGTVEISMSFDMILKNIKQLSNSQQFLFVMKKDYVYSKLYMSEKEIYKPLEINSDYVYEDLSYSENLHDTPITSTIAKIHQKLGKKNVEISEKMSRGTPFILSENISGLTYIIEFIPVDNVNGEKRGFIIFYLQNQELQQLFYNFLMLISTLMVFYLGTMFFSWRQYRSEKLLLGAIHQAEQANISKSEFLTNISHEIRTPLNGVLGMASVLSTTSLNEKQTNLLTLLQHSGESLLRIINDILDISRFQSSGFDFYPETFNLLELLDNIDTIFKEQFGQKKINFVIQQPSNLPSQFYVGDVERISQILINLLNNALKFTEQGYVILVVQGNEAEANDQIRFDFEISDTGIGINRSYQERIFLAFSQADGSITRKYGGTGLGLIISKKLALLMHGDLTFESTPGVGSKFTFEVPLEISKQPHPALEQKAQTEKNSSPTYKSPRILLVEDNIVNQEVAIGTLEYLKCIVEISPEGNSAVNKFKQNHYDLVLMDISMPVMDGFDATQHIRKHEHLLDLPRTPIIALTAHATKESKIKCFAVGMNDILTKPFTISLMDEILKKWLPAHSFSAPKKAVKMNIEQSNNKDVIDLKTLEQLREIQQEDHLNIVEKVLTSYLNELPKLVEEMGKFLAEGDSEEMWKVAHNLKSASMNVGALPFSELCLEIESSAKQDHCSSALVKQLQQQSLVVEKALNQQLSIERDNQRSN